MTTTTPEQTIQAMRVALETLFDLDEMGRINHAEWSVAIDEARAALALHDPAEALREAREALDAVMLAAEWSGDDPRWRQLFTDVSSALAKLGATQ